MADFSTEDSICLSIQKLIRSLLAMPAGSVRTANAGGPVGTTLFATVLLNKVEKRGWDEVHTTASVTDPNVLVTKVTGQRYVTASIQFFKSGANEAATRLCALLQTPASVQTMCNIGLGVSTIGNVRDLSALVDTIYEDRANIDIDFTVIVEEDAEMNTFGTFPTTIQNQ